MLTFYQNLTQQLLENPVPAQPLYTAVNLTTYINLARAQLALDSECLHYTPTFQINANQQNYAFSGVVAGPAGVGALSSIQQIIGVSDITEDYVPVNSRPWAWFLRFYVATNAPRKTGTPTQWAQLGEGVSSQFYLWPTPDGGALYIVDGIFLPIDLVDDSTPEAIPKVFQDAVPFYAAYYALLTSQRTEDAGVMFGRYKEYVKRARELSTPTVLPNNFPGGIGAQIVSTRQALSQAVGGKQ